MTLKEYAEYKNKGITPTQTQSLSQLQQYALKKSAEAISQYGAIANSIIKDASSRFWDKDGNFINQYRADDATWIADADARINKLLNGYEQIGNHYEKYQSYYDKTSGESFVNIRNDLLDLKNQLSKIPTYASEEEYNEAMSELRAGQRAQEQINYYKGVDVEATKEELEELKLFKQILARKYFEDNKDSLYNVETFDPAEPLKNDLSSTYQELGPLWNYDQQAYLVSAKDFEKLKDDGVIKQDGNGVYYLTDGKTKELPSNSVERKKVAIDITGNTKSVLPQNKVEKTTGINATKPTITSDNVKVALASGVIYQKDGKYYRTEDNTEVKVVTSETETENTNNSTFKAVTPGYKYIDVRTLTADNIDDKIASVQQRLNLALESQAPDVINNLYSQYSQKDDWSKNSVVPEKESRDTDYFNDQEKQIYYYIKNTEGEEAAKSFADNIDRYTANRRNEELEKTYEKFAKEYPVLSDLTSIGASLVSSFEQIGRTVDYWATGKMRTNQLANFATTVRKYRTDSIDWDIGNFDAFDFVYNTGNSIVESSVAALLPGGSGAIALGLSAAAQGTNDALERGMSNEQAFWNGIFSGTFEMLFEKVSIGEIKSLKNTVYAFKVDKITAIAKSMLVNASEETLTEIANMTYDIVANGDYSNYALSVKKWMNEGYTEARAKKKAALELGSQVAEAALGGLVSGGVMSSVSASMGYRNTAKFGKSLKSDTTAISTLFDYAENNLTSNTTVNDILGKFSQDNISNAALGTLYREVFTDVYTRLGNTNNKLDFETTFENIVNENNSDIMRKIATQCIDDVLVDVAKNGGERINIQEVRDDLKTKGLLYEETAKTTADTQSTYTEQTAAENIGVDGDSENGYNNTRGENDANGYNEQRGNSRGYVETDKTENTGRGSTGKSVRRESKESFTRRAQGNETSLGGRARSIVNKGDSVYSFVSVAHDNSNGGRAAKHLETLGVKVVFCDGPIEINDGERTFALTTAFTTSDGTVYISSESTLSDIETVLHEIVHVKEKLGADEYYAYESVVQDNLDVFSDAYEVWASKIYKNYIVDNYTEEERNERWKTEKELDDYIKQEIYRIDNGFYESLLKETAAYVNQLVSTDINTAVKEFSRLFRDWDAVVEASRQFNKDIGADFSESASFIPESESVLPDVSAVDGETDRYQRFVKRYNGMLELTEDQKLIQSVGKALGREVVFKDIDRHRTGKDGKRRFFSPDGYYDKATGKIYINTSTNGKHNPLLFVFKHELTHFAETAQTEYTEFANGVMDSMAFKQWVKSKGFKDGEGVSATMAMNADYVQRYGESKLPGTENFDEGKANLEMVADFVAENLFVKDMARLQNALSNVKPETTNKFKKFVLDMLQKLKNLFVKRKNKFIDIDGIEAEFIKTCRAAVIAFEQKNTPKNEKTTAEGGKEYSFKGYAEDGKGKYESNFPKGTPKAAKAERILQYIKNVWSKKPIRLKITENGETRYIEARFDPTYHAEEGKHTDASKLMGGNRHGTSSEQRVTLDLADDYYQIASESQYNYSKDETGKDNPTHKDVIKWHYFINDIYFAEYGSKDYEPYRVSINVKERADGDYVYSFSAEKQRESNTPRTLHAVVNDGDNSNANVQLSNNRVAQNEPSVNSDSMQETREYSLPKVDKSELLRQYKDGQLTEDEFFEALEGKSETDNPATIANLKAEDASTTPPMRPKKGINKGDKESKLYGSLLGSDIFDARFKEDIRNDSYVKTYQSTTNKETLKQAAKELDEGGREYVEQWKTKDAAHSSLIDITVGLILLDRYQRVGDRASAQAVAEKLRQMATSSGQQVQIFSILGRFDPDTMVAYAQKELTKAYEEFEKLKTQKWLDKNQEKFKLTPDDIEFIRRRVLQAALCEDGSRQKAILLAEICTKIQDKIPPESGQSIRALQRISMLLNVKTNIRNIIGNAGMAPVFIASDFFGTGIDKLVAKKTGVRTTGNFLIKGSGTAFIKGFSESWDDFKRGIKTKQEELDRFEVNIKNGKSFNEHHNGKLAKQLNAVAKKLNEIDNFTSFCLEAGDRPFFEMWMNNSLNNQKRLNNVEFPTPEMIDIAREEALQRTWQDNNKLTKAISGIKRYMNYAHLPGTSYGLGDFVLKFVKTPANLAKAIVDFSPVGLVFAGANASVMKRALEKGQFTPQMQKAFVRSLSNAITGTLIYTLVAIGASLGAVKLSGGGDEDKDVSNFEKYIVGIAPYSIEVFGQNITYDWMQPFGSILAIVADYMDGKNDESTSFGQDILSAMLVGGDVFTQQSFLSSFYDVFSSGSFMEGVYTLLLNEPSVFIPQFMSQMGSFLDDKRRVTYDATSDFQTAINKVITKIPGLRKILPEQVNVLGEDVENNQYLDPWMAFASPWNKYPESSGKVAEEIYELYKETGDVAVLPSVAPNKFSVKGHEYTFNTEQKTDFQREMGQASFEMLEILFKSDEYKNLKDAEKAKVIKKIYTYSLDLAKIKVVSQDYDYQLLSDIEGYSYDGSPILTKDLYNRLTDKARLYIIEENFLSKAEMKFKDYESAVSYYIKQAKK